MHNFLCLSALTNDNYNANVIFLWKLLLHHNIKNVCAPHSVMSKIQ